MTRSPGKLAAPEARGAEPVPCDVYDAVALRSAVVGFALVAVMHRLTDLPDDAAKIPQALSKSSSDSLLATPRTIAVLEHNYRQHPEQRTRRSLMQITHQTPEAAAGPASPAGSMRLLVTGGAGVLGRALRPLAQTAGHELRTPTRGELDLFDPDAVARATRDTDAVLHLATRIQPLEQLDNPEAWRENDRLRADASRILVDAALAASVAVYVQPTVTFVYPPEGPVHEDTPIADVSPILRSAIIAERETDRFAQSGRRGVVLRFGLLDGPGTGHDQPVPALGATLHVADAARALLTALTLPSGIYNVCRDHERVSNNRFTQAAGWHPQH
jgi:hypothetical protein